MKWNPKIQTLKPYHPNENSYEIRLDANESFLKIPQEILDEFTHDFHKLLLNRYPDALAGEVCRSFADFYNVQAADVTAGNGSDELISVIFNTFLQKGDSFATVAADFSMYSFYGHLAEADEIVIPKRKNFELDIDTVIETCNNKDVRLLIFSNPCNPTSLGVPRQEIRRLLQSVNCLVVLDEAYMDFWDQSLLEEYADYDNLIILRTCSKALAAAGIRIGFAVCQNAITKILQAAKSPYNVNQMTQKMAALLFSYKTKMNKAVQTVIASKKSLFQKLTEVQSETGRFELLKSETNFVSLVTEKPQDLVDFAAQKKIAIRSVGGLVRITCGNPKENDAVTEVIKEYYKR